MKNMKKALSFILCFVMLLTCGVTAFAGDVTKEQWQKNWADYDNNIAPAVTMFPGSDESERYIAWYSSSDEGYVELTSDGETKKIPAESKASADGGYRLWAVLTDLAVSDYTYTCHSGDFVSDSYSFSVEITDSFTALYVCDIHMAIEEGNENALMNRSYVYNKTLESAMKNADDSIGIIISGGDLASSGLTDEYIAEREALGYGKYISKDKLIDLSTARFKDTTWVTKNIHHDNWEVDTDVVNNFLWSTNCTPDNDDSFARFTVYNDTTKLKETMTEENCNTSQWENLESVPKSTLFTKLKALFNWLITMFKLLFNLNK